MTLQKKTSGRNILITHVYSNDNKGDAAILSVLVRDTKSAFPKSSIAILTFDEVFPEEHFDEVSIYQGFMGIALGGHSPRPLKFLYSCFVILATILGAILLRAGLHLPFGPKIGFVFDLYKKSDLVVGVGGGYLRGAPGLSQTVELALQLHPLLLSKILRQKVVLYSQSVGPFGNSFQTFLAKYVLRNVDLIITRENKSAHLLRDLGVTANVVRSVDSGFAFNEQTKTDLHGMLGIPKKRRIFGITVRKWLAGIGQDNYEASIAEVADYLVVLGYAVVFIPQVTSTSHNDDDRVAAHDIFSKMQERQFVYVLDKKYSHHEIKSIYAGLDYLIGTRFHSVIFSLTSLVPAIAIEYEHKTSGIMHDLGLDDWVINIEDVTTVRVQKLITKLLDNEESYRKNLKTKLPLYIDESRRTVHYLKDVVK